MKLLSDLACPDCQTPAGQPHHCGCKIDPCPACGKPIVTCNHQLDPVASNWPFTEVLWLGIRPGYIECARYDLYHDKFGKKCSATDPEAVPDVKELYDNPDYTWDPDYDEWKRIGDSYVSTRELFELCELYKEHQYGDLSQQLAILGFAWPQFMEYVRNKP